MDLDAYSPEEAAELLAIISAIYKQQTGDQLVIDATGGGQRGTSGPGPVLDPGPRTKSNVDRHVGSPQ